MSRLVRAELLKLRTTRLWWGLLIGVVLTAAAFTALQASIAGLDQGNGAVTPGVEDPAVVRGVYTAGVGIAYLFGLSLGVIAMAGEVRHQTLTATVLSSPRRARVVVAKAVAVMTLGLGYGLAAVVTGLAVGAPIVALRGGDTRLLSDGVPRALVLSVVAVGLWTLVGLGVGTLIRNQVVALLVTIGVAWIAEPLLAFGLNALDLGSVAQYLPSQATTALVSPPSEAGGFSANYLPWYAGGLVLAAYAAVSGGLGAALTLRRDVT